MPNSPSETPESDSLLRTSDCLREIEFSSLYAGALSFRFVFV